MPVSIPTFAALASDQLGREIRAHGHTHTRTTDGRMRRTLLKQQAALVSYKGWVHNQMLEPAMLHNMMMKHGIDIEQIFATTMHREFTQEAVWIPQQPPGSTN